MSYKIVGLVGRVGSGKSTVAKILFRAHFFELIDVDKIGHELLNDLKDLIVNRFGTEILNEENRIDRKKLSDMVFSDTEKLMMLNQIMHPVMKEKVISLIKETDQKNIVIDAALLFEIGLNDYCDYVLCVDAPDSDIISRTCKYRNWSVEKTEKVIRAQRYLQFIKEKTDFVIYNNEDMNHLIRQIEFFVHIIIR